MFTIDKIFFAYQHFYVGLMERNEDIYLYYWSEEGWKPSTKIWSLGTYQAYSSHIYTELSIENQQHILELCLEKDCVLP